MRTPTTVADAERASSSGPDPAQLPAVLRWGPVVGFGLLLLALSRPAGAGISDPDALWHVLAGDHLRRTWDFAGPDPLSRFTTGPWILTQWLPELAMSFAHAFGGLPAVAFLAQVGRLAVCVAIYVGCRREGGPLAATLAAGIAALATSASLSPRPQLVGFALLAVTTAAWMATLRDLRPRWWLVPTAWVWAGSHGTWVVGVMLGAAVTIGLVLDRRVGRTAAARLALVPLLSAVAALLTPLGLHVVEAFGTVRAVSPYIQEWRRPELGQPSTLALVALVLLLVGSWLARRDLRSWGGAAMLLVGFGWGFAYTRSVALGAIIIAPLAAQALDRLLGRPRPRRGREPQVLAALVTVAVAVSALAAWTGPREPVGVPTGLAAGLRALPSHSVVYNDDAVGGWLMWSFPELEQTADTRAELYGPARARDYLHAMGATPGWEVPFERDGPDAALLRDASPLAQALVADRHWVIVGHDRGFVLLRRPGS